MAPLLSTLSASASQTLRFRSDLAWSKRSPCTWLRRLPTPALRPSAHAVRRCRPPAPMAAAVAELRPRRVLRPAGPWPGHHRHATAADVASVVCKASHGSLPPLPLQRSVQFPIHNNSERSLIDRFARCLRMAQPPARQGSMWPVLVLHLPPPRARRNCHERRLFPRRRCLP